MRARALFPLGSALLLSAACDGFIRPPDPLEADPDVVTVAIMLVAGESFARMLAVHPHRALTDSPPAVDAMLQGPGWTAPLSETLPVDSCTAIGSDRWPGPATCFRASLPEAIRPGVRYGIEGTALPGTFTGSVVVPATLVLLEPGDTLTLPPPSQERDVEVVVRYRTSPDIGTVRAEIPSAFETSDDGAEVEVDTGPFDLIPSTLKGAGTDTLSLRYRDRPMRVSLRLLGIGWNYTNFVNYTSSFPLPEPWPGFGIDGEGVYGYFAAAAPSRAVEIRVR